MIFWCFFVSRTLQSWDKCVFRMSEWKWPKEWNERVHKFCSSVLIFAGTANFFFPTWRGVPGAYTDKRQTVTDTWNTLKKCLFWLKEAERGWKSGATPLSWKRGWKPSTRREFWAQRSSGSFFRFRDMAVWSWFSCTIKFYIVIFRLCSSALYSTWYSRGLTAVTPVFVIWDQYSLNDCRTRFEFPAISSILIFLWEKRYSCSWWEKWISKLLARESRITYFVLDEKDSKGV